MTEICRLLELEQQQQHMASQQQSGSFRPELTERSRKLAEQREKQSAEQGKDKAQKRMTSFEKLLARGDERKHRQESLRQSLLEEQMAECTFKPHRITASHYDHSTVNPVQAGVPNVNTANSRLANRRQYGEGRHPGGNDVTVSIIDDDYCEDEESRHEDDFEQVVIAAETVVSPSHSAVTAASETSSRVDASKAGVKVLADEEPAYQRLYKLKDKVVSGSNHIPFSVAELQHCTFKPVVDRWTINLPTRLPSEVETKSTEKSIARMNKAREMRRTEAERLEMLGHVDETKYVRSRELMAAGPVPFTFKSDERRRTKEEKMHVKKKPRLYIDVKLGPHRTVNIAIADEDNPRAIAEQFCRIYALDTSACDVLSGVVRENMEANGIAIDEEYFRNAVGPVETGYNTHNTSPDMMNTSTATPTDFAGTQFSSSSFNGGPYGDGSSGIFDAGDFDRGAITETSGVGALGNNTGSYNTVTNSLKPVRRKTVFRKLAEDINVDNDCEGTTESVRASQDDPLDLPSLTDNGGFLNANI
jgi:hypothetical protein